MAYNAPGGAFDVTGSMVYANNIHWCVMIFTTAVLTIITEIGKLVR